MSEAMRRLLGEHRQFAEDWYEGQESVPTTELAWEVASRRNLLDSARAIDPSLAYNEELTVRLIGESAQDGLLSLELSPLLEGVRKSFDAYGNVPLSLAGMSRGSTILHFRRSSQNHLAPRGNQEEQLLDLDAEATKIDEVGRNFVQIVTAAEASSDVRPWQSMVKGLEEVSKALDSFDLKAEIAWSSKSGDLVESALTSKGRRYIRSLSTAEERSRRKYVSGRVTEMRESGYIKLKTGTNRQSPIHEVHVPEEEILSLGLILGEQAHFLVNETVKRDRVGRHISTRLDFEELSSANEASAFDLGNLNSEN